MPVSTLGRYLARHRARYAAGVLLLLATNVCALLIPWVTKDVVDALGGAGRSAATRETVAMGALLVVVLALVQALVRTASRLVLLGAGQRVETAIRADLFDAFLRLEPGFYQTRRTGDLMSRATNDLQSVSMLVGFGLLSLVNTAIVYAGTLVVMLRMDPWLTLAALAPYPLLVGVARRYNTRAHAEAVAVQEQLALLANKTQENLSGMPVVRAYTLAPREIEDFGRLNQEHLARVLRQTRTHGLFSPLLSIMAGIGGLAVLWIGGRAVLEGRLSLGVLVAFAGYVAYLAWPTMALGWVLAIVRRGFAAFGRVTEILETPAGILDGPEATPLDGPVRGDIEIRRLTFHYAADRPAALRDVTLRIAAGTSVAVVGPTGAGKTTLAALLPRLWDPAPGTVFIDGREIHTIPLRDLRAAIGVVPQEAFLFSRPLRENVAFGASDTGVAAAAEVAGLLPDVARFPAGWDTLVGERGLTVSGGQRQRATLARALLRDPRILVLDDAFAAVDAETEAAILARLLDRIRERTTLVITHRLRVAAMLDRIVVLDEGRLVEEGTHAELLARGGLYARLWRRQQLESTIEAAG
jgi:ATP-binding cassette subfamily B protein